MTSVACVKRSRLAWASLCLLGAMALPGCATDPNALAIDPYEATNRRIFSFNEGLDANVLKPAAKAYDAVVPDPVEEAVANFTNNIKDVWSLTNLILQGQGAGALEEFMRIGVNTTFGMAGFVDVATSMGLDRHNEDLGQTLAVWGAPDGAYLVLPVFGPSTTRDTVAFPADQYVVPASLFREPRDANAARAVQVLNARAQLLEASELLEDAALDKYAFVRDAYLQRRRNQIYNGEPPEVEPTDDLDASLRGAPLWTARIDVPLMKVQRTQISSNRVVDQSRFFVDQPEPVSVQLDDTWSAQVDVPTLP